MHGMGAGLMEFPLQGLRVLELARILAGPWIGQTLADLGADVIKVEAPVGDETRRWGPPFLRNSDGSWADAAYFHCCNRGKRSIVANLRTDEGRGYVRCLARRADVLIENFKVGGLAKYGLDYSSLREINPRLVYCSVTGFGQDGPYAARAGYDAMIQAMSGIMDLTGERDGAPQKVGVAFADLFAGLYGVVAVQAALAQRERTGRGQQVDVALFDSMVGVLANQALNYLVSGEVPRRMGTAHPNIVPYQVFEVSDGHIMLAVGTDMQFSVVCEILDEPQLVTDARFHTNANRVMHRDELIPRLASAFKKFTRSDVLGLLEGRGVPAGPINSLAEVFVDPHVLYRNMRVDLEAPYLMGGQVPAVRTPLRFSDASLALRRPAPRLGEHTSEVLSEISNDSVSPDVLRDD